MPSLRPRKRIIPEGRIVRPISKRVAQYGLESELRERTKDKSSLKQLFAQDDPPISREEQMM